MKILLINKYHYIRGGSDSVYLNTGKLLQDKGHDVCYFAMQYPENLPTRNSKHFAENKDFVLQSSAEKIKNAPSFFFNKDARNNLEALIKEEKPDIAHLHIFYGSLTSSILDILKKYNIPAVVSVHDYKFVCPAYLFLDGKNEICERCEGNHFHHAIANKCVKNSYLFSAMFALEAYYRDRFYPLHKMFTRLIFVSKFSQSIHTKYKPELTNISEHLYNFNPEMDQKSANFRKGKYFLYAGRLSKEKGLKTLVSAFSNLPEVNLKVAGTGPEMEQLQAIAGKNIEFLGFKKGEELTQLISNASFVIVPSEWYENNPMAIIESYSLGKPVIASRIGGIPEIVQEGLTGHLFDEGNVDQLKELIASANNITEEAYISLATNSKKYASETFNPATHYIKLMQIYKDALADGIK